MFKPFQNLFQSLKGNINVFNSFDRTHDSLQDLQSQITAIPTVSSNSQLSYAFFNYNSSGRAFSTIYQNTSGHVRFVSASALMVGTSAVLTGYADTVTPPTGVKVAGPIQDVAASVNVGRQVFFVVLPNFYYEVVATATSVTLESWVEWEIYVSN